MGSEWGLTGERERDWVGVEEVGKPVVVTEMKRQRVWMRMGSDQVGLLEPRQETASSRRDLSLYLSRESRIACLNVSGGEPYRGHVVSGSWWYQNG